MNDTLKTILTRSSLRDYTGAAIPREQLDLLVRAAMAAPTAVNVQPWSFVVVTRRATLNRLAEGLPFAKMLRQAGAAVVVCGLPEKDAQYARDYWVQDCSAATENLLLAAHSLGLGAVWTAVYPVEERVTFVREVLGLPENVIPLNALPIGVPQGPVATPKDKYAAENLHWEKW